MFKAHSFHEKTSKMLLCQMGNETHVAALVVLHLN